MAELDEHLLHALYGGMHGTWSPLMVAFTVLGSGWAAILLLPLCAISSTRVWARFLAAGIVGQAVAVWLLKRLVGRVRPWVALSLPPPIGTPSDPSFPSGHAAGSFCVAGFILFAAFRGAGSTIQRWAMALFSIAIAILIALSRVYLGAHFPSDVLAGAAVGGAFGAGTALLYGRHPSPRNRPETSHGH